MTETLDRYNELKNTSLSLMGEVKSSQRRLSKYEFDRRKILGELEDYREEFTVHMESVEILKQIIELKSEAHLKNLTFLLTLALRTIFHDRDYAVEIEVDEKRGANSATFYLIERRGEDIIKSPIEGGTGGSIRAIIGFVLQVFYIRYFKLAPVIYIDEAFSSISSSYIPTLIEFMRQLSELRQFVFVWITHDERVSGYADKVYKVQDGTITEMKVPRMD